MPVYPSLVSKDLRDGAVFVTHAKSFEVSLEEKPDAAQTLRDVVHVTRARPITVSTGNPTSTSHDTADPRSDLRSLKHSNS
jgi:hypothetical protein